MTRNEFAGIMAYLSAAVKQSLGDASLEVYFDFLGNMEAERLLAGVKRVILSHPWNTFPSVAEIHEAASPKETIDSSQAWEFARRVGRFIDPDITGPYMARGRSGKMELFDSQLAYALEGIPEIVVKAIHEFGVDALAKADERFARSQFQKTYEAVQAREARLALEHRVKAIEGPQAVVKRIGKAK